MDAMNVNVVRVYYYLLQATTLPDAPPFVS
jgi:hypothetical protein